MPANDLAARWRRAASRRLSNQGFALIAVILGLGAMTLLIVSYMTTGRLRLQSAYNIAGAAQAELFAEAAANATILAVLSEKLAHAGLGDGAKHDGSPVYCVLDNAIVGIVIEDESGKMDINTASETLLQAALTGFGRAPSEASAITRAISTFRSIPTEDDVRIPTDDRDGKPFSPKHAPFQTTLELDQVAGVDFTLFRALLPFITVHSHGLGVDPLVAPPALFAALAGFSGDEVQSLASSPFPNSLDRKDARFPPTFRQSSGNNAFLVHVETALPNGAMSVLENIFEMQSGDKEPYALREIRRGEPRMRDELRSLLGRGPTSLSPC